MSLPLDLSSPPSTIATEVASLVSIADSVIASIPLVFELLDTDDSKASISSKSQSRSSASIGFKEDKESGASVVVFIVISGASEPIASFLCEATLA